MSFWCELAWLDGAPAPRVAVAVDDAGRITDVEAGVDPPPGATELRGLVLPGFADAHSHAFHRTLRGRVQGPGSFWSWREAMYAVAARLEPDTYARLARAVFAELAAAGFTCVGEFHYLHHPPGGGRYDDPNAMAEALRSAAADAGLRLTLLDACYLAGGIGRPLEGVQRRFGDGDAHAWTERVAALREDPAMRIGAAIHSVRAVPGDQLTTVAAAFPDRPLHVHLSEQPAENRECIEAYGCTPAALLATHGAVTERTTVVHATHLDGPDLALLGSARVHACMCPTTERDLADGIGPARALADAGARLCTGTDQHVQSDAFEELRALETGERVRSGTRGWFTAAELVAAATEAGNAALGWPGAGRIAAGAPCDLVAVALGSPRTAGAAPELVPFVATAADVVTVVAGGGVIAERGRHARLGDVGALLDDALRSLAG